MMKQREIIYCIEKKIKDKPEKDLLMFSIKSLLNDDLLKKLRIGRWYSDCNTISSSFVYLAYKKIKQPKSVSEISSMFGTKKKYIFRCYNAIKKFYGMKLCPPEKTSITGNKCVLQVKPEYFIKKLINDLQLSPKTEENALEIVRQIEKKNILGCCSPLVIATSAVYVSSLLNSEKRTQIEVGDVYSITEVSIRKGSKVIIDKLRLKRKIQEAEKKWRKEIGYYDN